MLPELKRVGGHLISAAVAPGHVRRTVFVGQRARVLFVFTVATVFRRCCGGSICGDGGGGGGGGGGRDGVGSASSSRRQLLLVVRRLLLLVLLLLMVLLLLNIPSTVYHLGRPPDDDHWRGRLRLVLAVRHWLQYGFDGQFRVVIIRMQRLDNHFRLDHYIVVVGSGHFPVLVLLRGQGYPVVVVIAVVVVAGHLNGLAATGWCGWWYTTIQYGLFGSAPTDRLLAGRGC